MSLRIDAVNYDKTTEQLDLPEWMAYEFKVDGKWYQLEQSGGVWQLRNASGYISLMYSNSYTGNDVVGQLMALRS